MIMIETHGILIYFLLLKNHKSWNRILSDITQVYLVIKKYSFGYICMFVHLFSEMSDGIIVRIIGYNNGIEYRFCEIEYIKVLLVH